jgi:ATP-dependent Clp protease ATP-binding subunit ClpC
MGPTGVGKTELARALAEIVYGSEDNMIRLDMSEYMEQHSVSKLFGSPPGYVGYGEGGQLTEAVRQKPYSLILLDEVEKAHPRVWDTFLQVFEDGFMTDGQGRKVDFRNTIIIMTSNVGAEKLKEARMGFVGDSSKEINEILAGELKRTFRPEFLNRVDSVVFFKPLTKEDMREILYITISKYKTALDEKGIRFRLTRRMEDLLLEKGFDPEYGARPIRRALDEYLFNPIVDYYLEHGEGAVSGQELIIDWDPEKKEVVINVDSADSDSDKVQKHEVAGTGV